MRVLEINSVCGIRSTGRIALDIAEEFSKEGNEVKIAYGRESVPDNCKKFAVRIGTDFNVYVNGIMSRFLDNEGFNAKHQTIAFLKWADEFNPDLLILHNIHGYYINVELLFNWIKTRPKMIVMWTLHDCWSFTGHCSYFSAVGCNKWETQCSNCYQIKDYPKSIFFDRSKDNFSKKRDAFSGVNNMFIITPSHWLADLVKKSYLNKYSVNVINNTINLDIFKPTKSDFRHKYNIENKRMILGVASAWADRKGLNDFIKLSNMLDDKFVVVLIGLNSKQLNSIKSKHYATCFSSTSSNITYLKQSPKLLCFGKTNTATELAKIYTSADVFLNLTYEDNYPTVNLESQACGTPCITYRTGGSVESVPTGNIVEQGNLNDICKLINDFSKLEIKGFNSGNMAEEYLKLYKNLERI